MVAVKLASRRVCTRTGFPHFHMIFHRSARGKVVMSDVTHDPKENAQNSRADREFQKKFFALGRCCYYCGQPLALCRAHREHKTPKCRGGSNEISNIVPSCDRCNQMKAWRTEAEFLKDQPRLFAHDAQTIRG